MSEDKQIVKILDFNTALKLSYGQKTYGATGEEKLSAPEMYDGGYYSNNVDVWSVGIIAY